MIYRIRKVYCDPLKHPCIMDNPILIVHVAHVATVYLYGKINLPRIKRKNSLQTRQPHLQDLPPLQDSYNIFRALDKLYFQKTGFESSQIFNLHIFASGIFGYLLNGKTTCIFDNFSFMNRNSEISCWFKGTLTLSS